MDPAVAGLDFAKAGIVLANMIESYLAGGAPPSNPEGSVHDKPQDCRSTSVTASLRLCSSVDTGTGPLQSGERRAPVQSGRQGTVSRLEPRTDPDPRQAESAARQVPHVIEWTCRNGFGHGETLLLEHWSARPHGSVRPIGRMRLTSSAHEAK